MSRCLEPASRSLRCVDRRSPGSRRSVKIIAVHVGCTQPTLTGRVHGGRGCRSVAAIRGPSAVSNQTGVCWRCWVPMVWGVGLVQGGRFS